MKKNILFFILSFLIFTKQANSQDYVTVYGTNSQIFAAGLTNQMQKTLKAFSEAAKQRREMDFQIVNARKKYWDAINLGKTDEKLLLEYENQLHIKDMYFLQMEITSALSGKRETIDAFNKLIGILSGSEGKLDNGINMFAKNAFAHFINEIRSSIAKIKLNNISEMFSESFRNELTEIITSHKDSYLKYVSKRNISEYLISNPYSPLLSDNPDKYMSAIYMLFEKCSDKADCLKFVNDFKKPLDDDTFKLIAFRIKENNNNGNLNYIEKFSSSRHFYLDDYAYNTLKNTIKNTILLAENAKKEGKSINTNLLTEYVNEYYLTKRNHLDYINYCTLYEFKIEIIKLKWIPPTGEIKSNSNGIYELEISHPIYKNIPSTKFSSSGTNPDYHTTNQRIRDLISGKISSYSTNISICEDDLPKGEYKVMKINNSWQGINGVTTYYGKETDNLIKTKCSNIYNKCQDFFKNGKLRLESDYNDNGEITRYFNQFLEDGTQILKDGNGVYKHFSPNGNVIFEAEMREGVRDGVATWFYENGQIKQSALYKYNEGLKPSILRWEVLSSFQEDGKPREKGSLKEGNGTWINYDNVGNMIGENLYRNGVKMN